MRAIEWGRPYSSGPGSTFPPPGARSAKKTTETLLECGHRRRSRRSSATQRGFRPRPPHEELLALPAAMVYRGHRDPSRKNRAFRRVLLLLLMLLRRRRRRYRGRMMWDEIATAAV